MHAKPLHIIAFFILIGPAALIAQAAGMGTDGLFIAILLIGAVVVVVPWLFQRAMHSFGDRGAFLDFLLTPGTAQVFIEEEMPPATYQVQDEAPVYALPPAHVSRVLPEQIAFHTLDDPRAYESRLRLAPNLRPHADMILSGRISIFGVSGSGKSNTVAVLCEEIARFGVPFILADSEDEYSPLCRSEFLPRGYLAGSVDALSSVSIPRYLAVDETGAQAFGHAVIDQGLQVILNLTSYETDEEAARVLIGIIQGMRAWEEARVSDDRVSCMFILEEASIWLPQNPRESLLSKECLAELQQAFFATVVRRGRKRGIGFTFAAQRIAEIDKRAMSSSWTILHRQTQDIDLKRYEELGVDREQVMNLADGEAFVFSPLENHGRYQFRLRHSPHGAKTPGLESVLRHKRMLHRNPMPLGTYEFTTSAGERQKDTEVSSITNVLLAQEDQQSVVQASELEKALEAWKHGETSVRKLQKALNVTQYQAYELYRQLKERRLI